MIGDRIRRLRLAAGLTQTALAEAVKTTQQQINRYETGKQEPTVTRLEEIAAALKISPAKFWEVEDMKRTTYRNHVIDYDNLGRLYVYSLGSRYSEDAGAVLVTDRIGPGPKRLTDLQAAKMTIDAMCASVAWTGFDDLKAFAQGDDWEAYLRDDKKYLVVWGYATGSDLGIHNPDNTEAMIYLWTGEEQDELPPAWDERWTPVCGFNYGDDYETAVKEALRAL